MTVTITLSQRKSRGYLILDQKLGKILKRYKRKIREALEINRLKTLNKTDKTIKVLNRDDSGFITMNSRKSLFQKVGKHQIVILMLDFALV